MLATANTGEIGRGFGKNAGEWTRRVEIIQEELPGSKRSMYGYILTYSSLKGRTFKLCVLTRWDFNFCIRSSPLREGTVKGGRRQGRQKKMWEYNIREWAGLEFAKSQRAVEKREKWRKLIVKSSAVPQRPSRLRDYMMMMIMMMVISTAVVD